MTTAENNQELTTVGADANASVDQNNQEALTIAETSYQRLRDAVGRYVEAAIQCGKLVMREKVEAVPGSGGTMYLYGPVQFSHWQAHLPEAAKQYYNCDYCKQVWANLSTLAVMDEDGNLYYPVAAAFLECADDPVVAELFKNYPEVKEACAITNKRRATLYPVDKLSDQFLEKEVGGFCHFFGARDSDVIRDFNKAHHAMNDQMYIKGLFEQFVSTEINLPLLAKIFKYIEKEVGEKEHTALSRADDLVKAIAAVRRAQNLSGRGYLYLWALLHKRENSWLAHVNGSLLGIVLDTAISLKDKDDMEAALTNVKRLLTMATDGLNYKQKTAEAPVAAVEQAFKFLEEKGLKGTMERRLLPLSEVQSVIWKATVQESVAEPEKEVSAADQAFNKLMANKDKDAQSNKKMDEILGNIDVEKRMSLSSFINNLDAYASLSFAPATKSLVPIFITSAVTEGNHDELLTFADGIGEYASMLNTPRPYAYPAMVDFAGLSKAKFDGSTLTRMMAGNYNVDIPISAIFFANQRPGGDRIFTAHIDNFVSNFQATLLEHGSCILGTMIKSEHFGMSRALVELSKQIPLRTEAGASAAGGAMLHGGSGTVIKAILKDGTRETIYLTSAE